jgi:hypothetical protein
MGTAGPDSACGQSGEIIFYCTGSGKSPRLDSDRPYTLILNAVDNHGKRDGSPDTVKFDVNFWPEIHSISHQILDPGTGQTRVSWDVTDVDQGYGWGGDKHQALLKYRFRYRLEGEDQFSQWVYVENPAGRTGIVPQYYDIASLEPGTYELELRAYNGRYIDTRVDIEFYEFSVP